MIKENIQKGNIPAKILKKEQIKNQIINNVCHYLYKCQEFLEVLNAVEVLRTSISQQRFTNSIFDFSDFFFCGFPTKILKKEQIKNQIINNVCHYLYKCQEFLEVLNAVKVLRTSISQQRFINSIFDWMEVY